MPKRNLNIRLFDNDIRATLAHEAERLEMTLSQYIRRTLAQRAAVIERRNRLQNSGKDV